jgi:hypothetical protein
MLQNMPNICGVAPRPARNDVNSIGRAEANHRRFHGLNPPFCVRDTVNNLHGAAGGGHKEWVRGASTLLPLYPRPRICSGFAVARSYPLWRGAR